MPACPICTTSQTVKNGRIHNGKQRYKCQDCGRQFIEQPTKKVINQATRELIDRMLIEDISLAGIARVAAVSPQWLQTYIQERYPQMPEEWQKKFRKRRGHEPIAET